MGIAEVLLTRLPFPQVTLSLRKTRLHDTRTPIDIDFLGTLFVPVSFFCAPLEPPRTSSLLLCCQRPTNHQLRRDDKFFNFRGQMFRTTRRERAVGRSKSSRIVEKYEMRKRGS